MNNKNEISESHKLLAQYLEGNSSVTIKQIHDQEILDEYNYYLEKASFNIKPLKIILAIPVTIFQMTVLR